MTKPWVVYSGNTFYYSSKSQKSKIKVLAGFQCFSKLLEESFLSLAASARPRSPFACGLIAPPLSSQSFSSVWVCSFVSSKDACP